MPPGKRSCQRFVRQAAVRKPGKHLLEHRLPACEQLGVVATGFERLEQGHEPGQIIGRREAPFAQRPGHGVEHRRRPLRRFRGSGEQSIERIKGAIDDAATLIWNGPLGAFEMHPFDKATVEIAKYVAARTKAGKLVSVAGGGDTVAALNHAGVADDFSYISTVGGAFLEWMEGKELPGVAVLQRA